MLNKDHPKKKASKLPSSLTILPDKNAPRSKILMPLRRSQWRAPSQRSMTFGIDDQTRYLITARLHDGFVVWRGWFDDRDDADEFFWSLITGALKFEKPLWSLPVETWTPREGYGNVGWHPCIGESLFYNIQTQTFLTAYPGQMREYIVPPDWLNPDLFAFSASPAYITSTNASEAVPADWNSSNNSAETIGGGAGGASGFEGYGGGAGGAYSKTTNITLTPSGTVAVTVGGAGAVNNAGGDSWFNGASLAASSVGSKGGGTGTTTTGGTGGAAASGVGGTKYSGGNGGNGGGGNQGGGGAGSAAGTAGDGKAGGTGGSNTGGGGGGGSNGGSATAGVNAVTDGGNGGAGRLGTGAGTGGIRTSPGGAGTAGTAGTGGGGGGGGSSTGTTDGGAAGAGGSGSDWDSTHGGGGGGGGGSRSGGSGNGGNAGVGGLYGAGGGGQGTSGAAAAAAGAQGIVVVTYTPVTLAIVLGLNSFSHMIVR